MAAPYGSCSVDGPIILQILKVVFIIIDYPWEVSHLEKQQKILARSWDQLLERKNIGL